jgi:hypothetical protein
MTDEERTQFAPYLASSTNIVIDDELRGLSASIVGTETDPVKRARLIDDWVLANVYYWVKDPAHKKAWSPAGTTYPRGQSRRGRAAPPSEEPVLSCQPGEANSAPRLCPG